MLVDERVLEFLAERLALVLIGEVAVLPTPAGDVVSDAAHQLLHGVLADEAVRRLEGPRKYLDSLHVRRVLRQEAGISRSCCSEAGFVAAVDDGQADLPRSGSSLSPCRAS